MIWKTYNWTSKLSYIRMLLNKLRTQEGLQVVMWIVLIELTMDAKNLKTIKTIETVTDVLRPVPKLQISGEVPLRIYSCNELMVINKEARHNQIYRILPFGAIIEIRSLRLNHKKIKNNKQHNIKQKGVNPYNLTHIQITKTLESHNSKLKIATVNTQSIRNKDLQVMELISDHNLDLVIATETWLTDSQNDNIWLEVTCLNKYQLRMLVNNRFGWRGGGILLIYRKEYSVKAIKNGTKQSLQYSIWLVKARNKHLTIVGLYHPSYSSINPPNSTFIEEIIELLTEILPASNNHIILGDFNIHINNTDDVDAHIFSESMEALGLKQQSTNPTHKSNNILDLTFTEILSDIGVEVVETATYISDQSPVTATLNIKKEQVKHVQRVICKAAKISKDECNQEFNILNIRWDGNMSSLVNHLNNELIRVYDVLAPPNWVSSFLRTKQPWYDSEMKEFKKSVRHHAGGPTEM